MFVNIGILGASGRMGRSMVAAATNRADLRISVLQSRQKPDNIPKESFWTQDSSVAFKEADVVIDFSHASLLATHLANNQDFKKPFVLGTTGFTQSPVALLKQYAQNIPILHAPNTSLGIALLQKAISDAVRLLDCNYSITIQENHHRHKKDKPSGTALSMAHTVQKVEQDRGRKPRPIEAARKLQPSSSRTINIESIRQGETIGTHRICFQNAEEMLCFQHQARSRALFARGALDAAIWLRKKTVGLYAMTDLLAEQCP